ncbi:MAG: tRNA (adenosine(37)-N6)-threonylcarbamoyltransferase complex dimerization subunit type 1 TsaB [Gammaproteobacteria bacterium]|nr:tRNA (adenosine(37)-N6)-threonylcarbamoyltransferase complex dimerization subunit type 1 TsaB [Gammaproteobacteria bacterium]
MNVLAFETAAGRPSVCLRADGRDARNWVGRERADPDVIIRAAGGLISEAGLAPADLDFVACGRGPGAFTGVRLGIALAQGFALGAGCPVVGVSDLLALAWKARCARGWERVLAVLDARRGELYLAGYDFSKSPARECMAESLVKPETVRIVGENWALAGSGAALLDLEPGLPVDTAVAPDAETVAELALRDFASGGSVPAGKVEPIYLRDRVAVPSTKR